MRRFALALLASTALTGTAFGADIARTAPVASYPVAVGVNWTGVYLGGHIGWAWADTSSDYDYYGFPYTGYGGKDDNGFLGGGQIGFNYQVGQWVFGVEGDVSWTDLGTSHDYYIDDPFFYYGRGSSVDWIATLTGRIGYAWDNWLLYAKGGAAWGGRDGGRNYDLLDVYYDNRDDTHTGWTLGAGVEWAWTPNWSVKLEYDYIDFGGGHEYYVGDYYFKEEAQIHTVKLGVNYRFGGPAPAVAARY
ncbi:outer membrane protein [Blastochloris viridis]|uniref:Opacity protein antigens n=2 Tax=Blastochloris viridis TaxID=1079 RepID=A0A0P0ICA5_BLAVI|nr:outer membrane protein [Blastochloris viridis]ALK08634.1 OmpA-like transmembrane domain protein [Blastochloris viridis]CUU41297.1 Opacity protein antigens [Blastochloris viridis]